MHKFTTCIIVMLLVAATAGAQLQRTVMERTPEGTTSSIVRAAGEADIQPMPSMRGDYLVGQRSIDGLIYNGCGIGPDGHYASTENGGVTLPAVVENLDANGSVIWSYETDQSAFTHVKHGAVLAENPRNNGATVYGNSDGESWAWSHELPDCSPTCIAQTPDGSVVVVGVNKTSSGSIICYDGFTGDFLSSYELPAGGWTRVMDITADGSLVASRGNMLHVIETSTGTALHNEDAGASCDVVAISPDGNWLIAGWTSMEVFRRIGDRYALQWSNRRVAGTYASFAKVNSNGDIVCGLNTGSWNQTYVHMVNAADADHDGVLYTGPVGDGTAQEGVRSIFFGDDSDLAVLGNWGDANGATPEIMVFEFGNPRVVASLDTRGSIYAVDGFVDALGGLELVACGKQTHANQFGNGGDYYIMYVPNDLTVVSDGVTPGGDVGLVGGVGVYPNPFNPMTRVSFTLDRAHWTRVSVFDLAGKRVAVIADGVFDGGEQAVVWNGKDMGGRHVPSGNYVISVEAGRSTRAVKISLVR